MNQDEALDAFTNQITSRYRCPYCLEELSCDEFEGSEWRPETQDFDGKLDFHLVCNDIDCKMGRIVVTTDSEGKFIGAQECTGRNGYQQYIQHEEIALNVNLQPFFTSLGKAINLAFQRPGG